MVSSISDSLSRKNAGRPLKSYMWSVKLPDLVYEDRRGQDVSTAMRRARRNHLSSNIGSSFINLRDINHRVHSISMPFETFGTRDVPEGNHRWVSIDRKELTEFTMEIHEYEDMQTLKYLHQWMNRIQNQDGTYNPPAFFKKDIQVYRLSDANLMEVSLHKYHDCTLTSINDVTADYESSEIARYNVNFSVDNVSHTVFNIEEQISHSERQLLKNRIDFEYDDPANIRNFLQGRPIDDAYNVFDNVIDRVPGL